MLGRVVLVRTDVSEELNASLSSDSVIMMIEALFLRNVGPYKCHMA
jgi:hypothetical protein